MEITYNNHDETTRTTHIPGDRRPSNESDRNRVDDRMMLFGDFSYDPLFFYEAVEKSTDDYIYVVDFHSNLALVSEHMFHDFRLTGEPASGCSGYLVPDLPTQWGRLIHEKDRGCFFENMEEMLSGERDGHQMEYQIQGRQNEYVWVYCRGILHRDEDGAATTFAGVVSNLSAKGKADAVTGLRTMRDCERYVRAQLERAEGKVSMLLLGLDDFTKINDLKGHDFGDAVLRKFAQEVQRGLPPEAYLFRFDGDQFAITCPGDDLSKLKELFRQIQRHSGGRHAIDGVRYYCSVSGGVATVGGEGYADLLRYAASALDQAKRSGRSRCAVFRPELIVPKLRSLELMEQLQICVLGNMRRFSLMYQPFVQAGSMELSGAEALLRWKDEKGHSISPVEFIPLLEASGMMVSVGRWVLERAVCQCLGWVEHSPSFVLHVNVSFLQMQDPSFVPMVKGILDETGFAPANLVLELTESRFVTNHETLRLCFQSLRDMGIRIAMDDFGTGYSSLGMLYQCPADIVKIDRVFISKIDDQNHRFHFSFIQAVIQLCHSIGLTVCVEGVEETGELETVRSLGADSIQGYYVSKPLDEDTFVKRYL